MHCLFFSQNTNKPEIVRHFFAFGRQLSESGLRPVELFAVHSNVRPAVASKDVRQRHAFRLFCFVFFVVLRRYVTFQRAGGRGTGDGGRG